MSRKKDDPASYLERVGSIYVSLFRIAYAMIGNRELAEYVFRSAIVEAYLRRKEWQGRMSFRDGLEHTVRGVALAELKRIRDAGTFETDWFLPQPVIPDGSATAGALYELLGKESEATQRIAVLYYACQLNHRQIGRIMQMRPGEIAGRLRRLTSRLLRSLHLINGQKGQRILEDQLEKLLVSSLSRSGEDVPETSAVFRSFERDVDGATRPGTNAGRLIVIILKIIGAVILAGMIWFMAVLLEPSAPVDATQDIEQTLQQSENEILS